jgi:hypothetical protein
MEKDPTAASTGVGAVLADEGAVADLGVAGLGLRDVPERLPGPVPAHAARGAEGEVGLRFGTGVPAFAGARCERVAEEEGVSVSERRTE